MIALILYLPIEILKYKDYDHVLHLSYQYNYLLFIVQSN